MKSLMAKKRELNRKRPKFKRDGYGKRKRISSEWKRPTGRHNKMKDKKAGHRRMPMPGFRSNRLVRGLHYSGLMPILIKTLSDVARLDRKTQGAIVASSIGGRKKLLILDSLKKANVPVLNLREDQAKLITDALELRKKVRDQKVSYRKDNKKKATPEEKKKASEKEVSAEEKAELEKKEKDKILTKSQ